MKTFAVVHKDSHFGLSVDFFSGRSLAARRIPTFFRISASSAVRLRHLWVADPQSVEVFDGWSASRIDMYRQWANSHPVGGCRFPSLDHMETSEPSR